MRSWKSRKANAKIAARSATLGVPKDFAPSIHQYWGGRGDNGRQGKSRRTSQNGDTRIMAIEANPITEIEIASVEAQTLPAE